MLDQHVRCEATVDHDSEMARVAADVFVTGPACSARAAADPGIDGDRPADPRVPGLGACALDAAGDLVAKGERQRTATADVQSLVATELEITILHMQVGMTDAATLDPHQHLGAHGLRA